MERVANNNLFMNAFNFSAIGMAIVSMDGRFSKVNSSLCKILGYTASEL
jgi:PAS domain S-box-containing protein